MEEKIIRMLPYRTYKDLERLIEYVKTSDDIYEWTFKRFLKDNELGIDILS